MVNTSGSQTSLRLVNSQEHIGVGTQTKQR